MHIHSTIGVYANGDRKHNGVSCNRLAEHIVYNLKYRPGRALFVDGVCVHTGYLDEETVAALETEFKDNPHKPTRDTVPYH